MRPSPRIHGTLAAGVVCRPEAHRPPPRLATASRPRSASRRGCGKLTSRGARSMLRAAASACSHFKKDLVRVAGTGGKAVVAPAKRERLLAVVKAVGYASNGMARGLASRPHGVIGLIFPGLDDPSTESGHETLLYSDEVIRGAERSARAAGHAILIAATHGAGGRDLAQAVGPWVKCRVRGRRDRTVDHLRGGALRRDVALDELRDPSGQRRAGGGIADARGGSPASRARGRRIGRAGRERTAMRTSRGL